MNELVEHFLGILPQMTKEQADCVEEVVKWNGEKKAAFIFAKSIFEANDDEIRRDDELSKL